MVEIFLHKEAEHKAAAEKAALAGDWRALRREAEALVKLYGAILASGMVAADSLQRWRDLRCKWREISQKANVRIRAGGSREKKSELKSEQFEAPESIKVDDDAIREINDSAQNIGSLKLDDVKGLNDAKQIVMDALVNPVLHPDIYKKLKIRSGKGLLLYGPPGTGKTMFARAIAGEMNLPFVYKKISELKDKYVGESEKGVARLFEEAWSHERAVVFLDECEGLLRKRGNQKVNIVEAFIAELDGFATNRKSQIFILLATNRPWLIDSAVMRSGRIGAAVYVGLPDAETRKAIISAAIKDIPIADDVNIDEIVSLTEGYSGAELNHSDGGGVCNLAEMSAGRRWIARRAKINPRNPEWSRDEAVLREDFLEAIKKVTPVSKKDPDIIKKNLDYASGDGALMGDGDVGCD